MSISKIFPSPEISTSVASKSVISKPLKSRSSETIAESEKFFRKVVKTSEGNIETGIKKFGAMLGDEVEVGCGTVLNPGSVVGKQANIYPLSSVRGFVPANSIYKKQGEVVEKYY